jgi:hypothetical protein
LVEPDFFGWESESVAFTYAEKYSWVNFEKVQALMKSSGDDISPVYVGRFYTVCSKPPLLVR